MIETSRVERWLREDLGHHDVTNQVPGDTTGRLVAKAAGIAAGLTAAVAVFEYLGVEATPTRTAGDAVDPGDPLVSVEGPARDVLRGERVAVNVAGHASGIATRTRAAVDAARTVDEDVTIAATRKTTPGLRGIEKRAVVAGGGDTHRLDLSHMAMVKDNHISAMGLETAVEHVRERISFATLIEVEAASIEAARRAVTVGADIVLLDNMDPSAVRRGVEAVEGVEDKGKGKGQSVLVEASGGITVDDVPDYAETGVDIISLGTLTHSAPALDLSFTLQ